MVVGACLSLTLCAAELRHVWRNKTDLMKTGKSVISVAKVSKTFISI